jgi:ribonucleoside-diphosphate reductase alpha chain
MGIADMLIKLEKEYGSDESLEICDTIATALAETAIETSHQLAKKYGAFPMCEPDKLLKSDYFYKHCDTELAWGVTSNGLRNSQLLTIAPTGTISTMLGVSGGIEPIFANYYERKTESLHGEDVHYKVYTPIVEKYMKEHGITDDADLPNWFVTSKDIVYKDRINMQGVWQDHIDASISSTVNVPNDFTVEQVEELYMYAWERGLKGITIFRDGCERAAILSTGGNDYPTEVVDEELVGYKRKLMTGCGSLHLCAYFTKDGELKETFLAKGSTGGCNNFMIGLSRVMSLAARNGVSVSEIVDQLKSTGSCPSYAVRKATKGDTSKGSCCPVAIGNALMELSEMIKTGKTVENVQSDNGSCPECGGTLKHEMGCVTCTECGYSKCG